MMSKHAPPKTNKLIDTTFEERIGLLTLSIEKYHSCIEAYLFKLTNHKQDAEDLAQELWIYILHHFKIEQIDSFALIRRKAYHLFIDHYRRHIRCREISENSIPEQSTSSARQDPETIAEENELKLSFWSDFPEVDLTDPQKEALWLYARYGYTYAEIHERIGIPESTICDWIKLSRERLAKAINL